MRENRACTPPTTTQCVIARHRHRDGTISSVSDGQVGSDHDRDVNPERGGSIDELIDRALLAANTGQ